MSLKTEEHTLERGDIVRIVCAISSEVHVDTTATQLRTQIAARQQLIGSHQHVNAPRQAGQRLKTI
jgi:hypothetical protein